LTDREPASQRRDQFALQFDPSQFRGGYFTIINLEDNSYGRSQTSLRKIFGAAFSRLIGLASLPEREISE